MKTSNAGRTMDDLRSLAAGTICVGFESAQIDGSLERALRDTPVSGLILFGRNVRNLEQTRALTDRIRSIYSAAGATSAPIIAIDQEGGRVARIRDGVEEIPSMMALAATGDLELAVRAGERIGFDLRRAGVNVNFAPVLDLALFAENTVIGARAFGDDPARVSRFAGAIARGLREQAMVATYKHFPGHGSTATDTHLALPEIELDEVTLRARDLVPFARLLPDAQAVMTAHIVVRSLDALRPATLSKRVLTGLLRDEMRFRGVCFTDCLEMDAIAKSVGTAAGAVLALQAGADCMLISHRYDLACEAIEQIVCAVESGTLPRARLEEAHHRVASLRASLAPPLPPDAPALHAGIGREIGRRAVTVLRGSAVADAGASVIVSFEGTTSEGVAGKHADHAPLAPGDSVETIRVPLEPNPREGEDALVRIAATRKRPIVLMRRAHIYATQAEVISNLLAVRPDAMLVSVREPYDAALFAQACNALCTYGDDAPSMDGLADVIFGGVAPQGTFPLQHEPLAVPS